MKKRFVLMSLSITLLSSLLVADDSSTLSPINIGLTIGLGGGGFASNQLSAGSFLLQLDGQRRARFVALRWVILSQHHHKSDASEVSVLYGLQLTRRDSPVLAKIAVGIGIVGDAFSLLDETVLGIPLEAQLFTRTRGVQIGVVLLANINSRENYWGWTIALRFGRTKY